MTSSQLNLEQPFHSDLGYYRGRAHGIASVNGVSMAEARRDLAARHGFGSWRALRRHVEAMHSGAEPPTPFVLAYRAIEDADCDGLRHLLDRFPDLIMQRGTNGNDLIGMATTHVMVRLLLDRGAEGVTAIHLAAQAGEREAVLALLELGADPLVVDGLHGGNARGWAGQGGHDDLAQLLP